MRDYCLSPAIALVGVSMLLTGAAPTGGAQGAPSATAALRQLQTAVTTANARDLLAVMEPGDQLTFAQNVAGVLALSVMAHIDDTAHADQAMKDVDALLARHKVTAPLARPPAQLFEHVDVPAFLGDALAFLKKQFPKPADLMDVLLVPSVVPQDAEMAGDVVPAKVGDVEVTFVRVNGRWFFHVPATVAVK